MGCGWNPWVRLTESIARIEGKHFIRRLGRFLLGTSLGAKLKSLLCLERGAGGALHYHGAVEIPPGITAAQVKAKALDAWRHSDWSQRVNRFEVIHDRRGWIDYCGKGGGDARIL